LSQVEQTISNLIPSQFPSFYNEQGPNLIAFIQAYYEWMEQSYDVVQLTVIDSTTQFANNEVVYQSDSTSNIISSGTVVSISGSTITVKNISGTFLSNTQIYGAASGAVGSVAVAGAPVLLGNPIYMARQLMSYADVDTTLDDFLVYFTDTYLSGIQYTSLADKRLTVKKVLDLYRAKGNIRGLKLLFNLVFGEDITVYLPGEDIFTTSSGTWIVPQYLEVTASPRNASFVGKTVTGVSSGATAFVDHIVKRKIGAQLINLFYITNVSEKNFQTGELLSYDNDLTNVPFVLGSLSELIVQEGGYGFNVGDIVPLNGQFGAQGTGRVTGISDVTGIVSFIRNNGGWGYANNANILISNTVIGLSNVHTTLPTSQAPFEKFSNVTFVNPSNLSANLYANSFAYGANAAVAVYGVTGSFTTGEKVTTSDDITANVITYSSNTLVVTGLSNSYFGTGVTVTGQTSGATATVNNFTTEIGVIGLTGALTNAYTYVVANYPRYLTVTSNTAAFVPGELIYQSNGSANVATGILLAANSSQLTLNVSNGAFVTTYQVEGNVSSANAVISAVSAAQNVSANIISISTGTYANMVLGVINSSETIFDYADMIDGYNSNGQLYLSLSLNAISYGFPKFPSANLTVGYLNDILSFSVLQVGEIESILQTNPGENYNHSPYVEIYQPYVAALNKQDYVITIANPNGSFLLNEEVTQNVATNNAITVNLTTKPSFTAGESVYQVNSTPAGTYLANSVSSILLANTGAPNFTSTFAANNYILIGGKDLRFVTSVINSTALQLASAPSTENVASSVSILSSIGVVSNIPQANILYVSSPINTANVSNTTTFVASQNVFGLTSLATSNVSSVGLTSYGTAIGKVLSVNNNVMSVRRWSVNQDFSVTGNNIVGVQSGTSANVVYVAANTISSYAGDNANVTANVVTETGTVTSLAVQTSGIGYVNAETVTFSSNDGTRTGTAIVNLGKQGVGVGFYTSTKGFLSADKYLQDGEYYQTFSYEIKSSLDSSHYEQMVEDVVHMAGTKLFGAVVKSSTISKQVEISNANTGPTTH